jgi:hypothetical protein
MKMRPTLPNTKIPELAGSFGIQLIYFMEECPSEDATIVFSTFPST